jgi:putative ABC transport system substrate-binding protein
MRRRDFIVAIGGAAATWPLTVWAQQRDRPRRVGILIPTVAAERADAFKKGMAALGWVEGHNIRFEERGPSGPEQVPIYAAELARLAPDLIFVASSPVLQAMRHATSDIPIVFAAVVDPVGQGFVSSLARPGGNITGFANVEFGVASKKLDLLKKLAPTIDRVAYLYDPSQPAAIGEWAEIEAAAPSLALHAVKMPVRTADDIERVIAALAGEPNASLFVTPGPATVEHANLIVKLAAQYRLPSVFPRRQFVEAGGLASYGTDVIDLCRRAASYVDRILKGEKPRDLPVQLPVKLQFVVNLKTAKTIGLDISAYVLAITDEVIE